MHRFTNWVMYLDSIAHPLATHVPRLHAPIYQGHSIAHPLSLQLGQMLVQSTIVPTRVVSVCVNVLCVWVVSFLCDGSLHVNLASDSAWVQQPRPEKMTKTPHKQEPRVRKLANTLVSLLKQPTPKVM